MAGCATTREPVEPVGDLTGRWVGTWLGEGGIGTADLRLTQDVQNVTGVLTLVGFPDRSTFIINGVVEANRLYSIIVSGLRHASFSVSVKGDTMVGTLRTGRLTTLHLRRVVGMAEGPDIVTEELGEVRDLRKGPPREAGIPTPSVKFAEKFSD